MRQLVSQYEKLIESLPDAMVIINRVGRIVTVNAQIEKLFGYGREELQGRNLEILMPARFRARHRKNVSEFLSQPRIRPMGTGLELFGLRKDGAEFPVDISLSFFTTGGEVAAIAAIRDITERKKTERDLNLNYLIQRAISSVLKISLEPVLLEEQLSKVLDLIITLPSFETHALGSIYLVEGEDRTLVLRAMHGFSVSQATSCHYLPLGEGIDSARAAACQIISPNCLDELDEIQYAREGNTAQYCAPIVFGKRPLGLINVAVSEGHQRIPEEEEFLAAIANSLAGLIERYQTETEKNRLREQLAETEKFVALGRITANVSHTIKNPLTAIGGFANRLMDKLPEGTQEKKYAGLIYTEAVRLENVLQNVLLFSRHDKDRLTACSIPEIVEKALVMYEDICREKLIAINRDLKDVPLITGNKEQLLQAIENLLSNAIDAMARGGSLTVDTDVEKKGESSFVRLKIRDTGYGIETENIKRIFEPFFTTKLLLKGTGLGLSITKKVVDDHGGFIRVDSRVGKGTTFDVLFPIKRT
ncbi:MAG TPA: PAS domain S-box protein [Nitrospirota bacterium]|nr:PAS domain S-box protein [Nitrospirota bacterium]